MEAFLEFRKKCKYRKGNSCFYNIWEICSEETCPIFESYKNQKVLSVKFKKENLKVKNGNPNFYIFLFGKRIEFYSLLGTLQALKPKVDSFVMENIRNQNKEV